MPASATKATGAPQRPGSVAAYPTAVAQQTAERRPGDQHAPDAARELRDGIGEGVPRRDLAEPGEGQA